MPEVSRKLKEVLAEIPDGVKLVAVSKFQPIAKLQEAYAVGQRLFGESRADELAAKAVAMPADIEWHFIGHLQTNKVRHVVAYADVIQSIDSERLLRAVSAEAAKAGRTIKVLLQVHVAAEDTKTGLMPEAVADIARLALSLPGIEVCGVMGMASNTDDSTRIADDFRKIADCARALRKIIPEATEVSMGMSGDWPQAVVAGATIVRIGSAIFGQR